MRSEMRILLLHPEDSFGGPWMEQGWDWIVDLGRAPKSFYEEWSGRLECRVSSLYDYAREVEDLRSWVDLFALGMGQVVDRFGVDWWDVIGLSLQSDMQDIRLVLRLAEELKGCRKLVVSRPSLLAQAAELRLGTPLKVLQTERRDKFRVRAARYRTAFTDLSWRQLQQVAQDKFDPHYFWRRKFVATAKRSSEPVVLLPSAYSNVTKTGLRYARLLPGQRFLLVLARESGAPAQLPGNVHCAPLAAFAGGRWDDAEFLELDKSWMGLKRSLGEHPTLGAAAQLGLLERGSRLLRWGVSIRNAWNRVFETRPVTACLSADDSNPYTRIPLILAKRRGTPAIACHHGALDCRMAFKVPEFSTYLAQGEMESDYVERICRVDSGNVRIGAAHSARERGHLWRRESPWIVFFTEPYESDYWRAEAMYREIVPRLCTVARRLGKTVVLKLHPFETAKQRRRLVREILGEDERRLTRIVASPISEEILRNTWCALTVESTVACECAAAGIPVFLFGWLRHAYAGYAAQYARFGVGRILEKADDLLRIPEMTSEFVSDPNIESRLRQPISAYALAEVLSKQGGHLEKSLRCGSD